MPLTRVSLTGPDDHTSVADLVRLAERYPFVEWAILYSPKREGTGRYPSADWRRRFEDACQDLPIQRAIHVCGQGVPTFAAQGPDSVPIAAYQRVQWNVNLSRWDRSDVELFLQRLATLTTEKGVPQRSILQHNKNNEPFIHELPHLVDVLYDASGGHGKVLDTILGPWYTRFTGYAGGLGPDNVVAVVQRIQEANPLPFYMDMESSLRTDDRFDLDKAGFVLKALAPFVVPAP